jgi:hypothetical protein
VMLQAAGFSRVVERRTGVPMVTRLLVATR